jgi:hypothetical protein
MPWPSRRAIASSADAGISLVPAASIETVVAFLSDGLCYNVIDGMLDTHPPRQK